MSETANILTALAAVLAAVASIVAAVRTGRTSEAVHVIRHELNSMKDAQIDSARREGGQAERDRADAAGIDPNPRPPIPGGHSLLGDQ